MIEMMIGEWSEDEGEGGVELSADFFTADRIVQLDFLVDMIQELTRIYNEMLEHPNEKI